MINSKIRTKITAELKTWRVGVLPGIVAIGVVMVARLSGTIQFLEWTNLDTLLRLRPPEAIDERILIIGINEKDIRQVGTYPIPDGEIAEVLRKLQSYQPSVIGIDIYRDLPVSPGNAELVAAFKDMKNVIAIEKSLPDTIGLTVKPPRDIPAKQIGFADAILDTDGHIRRSLIGTSNRDGKYKFSLTIRLAETYLNQQGITLENGTRDPWAMRFGSTELTRFRPNSGGYVRMDSGGNQILLNFRSGRKPFRMVSLSDIKKGKVHESWIRDRIIIIGITTLSAPDLLNSNAISDVNPGLIYGVQIQAHAVSQIVSAVLDGRPLLNVWADAWEYLWIFIWGVLGISIGRFIQSPLWSILYLGLASITLTGICYGFLLIGWWIPFVPPILALFLNGAGLAAFYRYEQDVNARLKERQSIIDQTFDTIHNGPLQTLAKILRRTQEQDLPPEQLILELQYLNQELRAIYESMRRKSLTEDNFLYLGSNLELDLHLHTHEILYEVYSNTIARDFPCFKTLKVKVIKFENIDSRVLSISQKRDLCRFLEEALCNVGKYAEGATRLEVICTQENSHNLIRITDNGVGLSSSYHTAKSGGRGTRQARNLARSLGGKFQRLPRSPKGTICELTWHVSRFRFWHF